MGNKTDDDFNISKRLVILGNVFNTKRIIHIPTITFLITLYLAHNVSIADSVPFNFC